MSISLVFILFGVLSLAFSFYNLFCALRLLNNYREVKKKVLSLKLQNNSKVFIEESLISEGFDKSLILEVIEEVFFGSA